MTVADDQRPKRPLPLNSPPGNAVVEAIARQGRETREKAEDLDNRLTTLEGQKLPSRVAYIFTQQQQVERAVTRMSDILDGIVKSETGENGCWDWSQFNREQAAQAWEQMLRWRREVFQQRWPKEFRKTAVRCWYMHPAAVEAMSALYTSWDYTFHHKHSNPARVADWLRFTLPQLADAIAEEVARCDGRQAHQPPVELGAHQREDDEHLSAWIGEELQARPPAPPKEAPQMTA